MYVVEGTGKDFHDYDLGGRQAVVTSEEIPEPMVRCTPGRSKKLDPSRRVDEDQSAGGRAVRSDSRFPSQPLPSRRSASSLVSGCPTSSRSARSTASRLVLML